MSHTRSKASFESEAYGRVDASFLIKTAGVDGFVVSDSRSGVDNLKVIGVDVISYGCLSKVCACTICFPLSTIFSCFFSILGGYLYCVFYSGISSNIYMEALISYLNFHYITLCLVKSIVFGFLCGSVGSYLGFCFNKSNNLSMISISQHCFTVCCIVVLCGDIIINIIDTTFFKLPV